MAVAAGGRTVPGRSFHGPTVGPPVAARAGCPPPGTVTRRFPCSLLDRSSEEAPDTAPAVSPWLRRSPSPWPPKGCEKTTLRSSPPKSASAHRDQPRSTRFELVTTLRDVTRRFLAYTFPTRSPGPRHLAVLATSRPCQGRLPPSPAPPGSGCPQLRRPAGEGLSPPHDQTAPHGATAHPSPHPESPQAAPRTAARAQTPRSRSSGVSSITGSAVNQTLPSGATGHSTDGAGTCPP